MISSGDGTVRDSILARSAGAQQRRRSRTRRRASGVLHRGNRRTVAFRALDPLRGGQAVGDVVWLSDVATVNPVSGPGRLSARWRGTASTEHGTVSRTAWLTDPWIRPDKAPVRPPITSS